MANTNHNRSSNQQIYAAATKTHPGLSATRKPLSPKERGCRTAEGPCLRCGCAGHMARACPNRSGQGPARNLRAAAATIEEAFTAPAVSTRF